VYAAIFLMNEFQPCLTEFCSLFFLATLDELKVWSGDIGSDITFFFSTGTAYCTGRGEIVTPLPALPDWRNTKVHVFKPK
jgi:4-diphosphocytidyl-2C-methyl-D-erythritol kinase